MTAIIDIKNKVSEDKFNELISNLNILKIDMNMPDEILDVYVCLFCLKEKLINESQIEMQVGKDRAFLVKQLFHLEGFKYVSKEHETEKIRSMFFAMAKDIKVVFISLAMVLTRLRKLRTYDYETQKIIIQYAEDIYEPLAEKLGFYSFKSEMGDIILKWKKPRRYDLLEEAALKNWGEVDKALTNFKGEMLILLDELEIKGEVAIRRKHISSVYKKIQDKQYTLSKIYDFAACRIIVPTIEDCYTILGRIHKDYTPILHRFKDYIAAPKPNGYQSLHTAIVYINGKPIEVQIRTLAMHKQCEYGVSAHWLYKEKRNQQNKLDKSLGWLRELLDNQKNLSAAEFLTNLPSSLIMDRVFVQTPKGDVFEFPRGSTCLDFAYRIHSEIGNHCAGALMDKKSVKISSELTDGATIEILTNKNIKPNRDWISLCKTGDAKQKILHYFKMQMKDENIKKGKILLTEALKTIGNSMEKIETKTFKKVLDKCHTQNFDELCASLGVGDIKVSFVLSKFKNELKPIKVSQQVDVKIDKNTKPLGRVKVSLGGYESSLYFLANCCCPHVGDDIMGYISSGKGISVHTSECLNLKYLEADRLYKASWKVK